MGYPRASYIAVYIFCIFTDYVVGVPRGRQLQGKVVIYTQNLTLIKTIKGEQVSTRHFYAPFLRVEGGSFTFVLVHLSGQTRSHLLGTENNR